MQLRADGNTALIEAEAAIRDERIVRDRNADPLDMLSRFAPGGVPGMTLRFFDLTIELHSDAPEVLDDVRGFYSNFVCGAVPRPDVVLYAVKADDPYPYAMLSLPNGDRGLYLGRGFSGVACFQSFEDLLFHVHGQIEVLMLINSSGYAFIHGAAVEKDGVGYMMPADSRSGKTTLTMAFLSAGYRFLSDEFAVLDSDGMIAPFPRSMSVRPDTLRLFPNLDARSGEFRVLNPGIEESYSIDAIREFGGVPGVRCPVRYVLFPHYDPDSEPSLSEITRMTAVGRLIGSRNYVSLGTSDKQSSLDRLLAALSNARCFDLTTNDLDKTLALIRQSVER